MTDISGKYDGVLTYLKGYRNFAGKKLYFEMDIKKEGDNFTGTARDSSGFGVQDKLAKVKGKYSSEDGVIVFAKQYETLVAFKSFSSDESVEDTSQKGLLIIYEGKLIPEKIEFSGTWEIKIKVKLFSFIPWTVRCGGIWKMKKAGIS